MAIFYCKIKEKYNVLFCISFSKSLTCNSSYTINTINKLIRFLFFIFFTDHIFVISNPCQADLYCPIQHTCKAISSEFSTWYCSKDKTNQKSFQLQSTFLTLLKFSVKFYCTSFQTNFPKQFSINSSLFFLNSSNFLQNSLVNVCKSQLQMFCVNFLSL